MVDLPTLAPASARAHVLVSLGTALVVGGAVGLGVGPVEGALAAWIAAAVVFLGWTWMSLWRLSSAETAVAAVREDPSRVLRDVLLLAAAIVALASVATVIVRATQVGLLRTGLAVVCVASAWAVLHTIFALAYARRYYSETVGGIDFGSGDDWRPAYRDFAYLAFTVGMTFQVSDTQIETTEIRAIVLRHALLSFVFGTILIAVTINVIAGLGH